MENMDPASGWNKYDPRTVNVESVMSLCLNLKEAKRTKRRLRKPRCQIPARARRCQGINDLLQTNLHSKPESSEHRTKLEGVVLT